RVASTDLPANAPASIGSVAGRGTARDYFERALAAYESGDMQEAVADATRVIQIDDRYPGAHRLRGGARGRLGDLDGSWRDLDPDDVVARMNRVTLRRHAGDHRGALEDCVRVTELAPKDSNGWHECGVERAQLGDLEGARDAFDRSIDLDPKYATARINRGMV